MKFADLFKIWSWALESDPYGKRQRSRSIEGSGIADTQVMPDLRGDGNYFGGSRNTISLRGGTDLIDLSSVSNRISRYKEYERLLSVSEINAALTIYAEESCVAGDTRVATPFGYIEIQELAKTKQPDEEFLVYCYDFEKQDFTLGWAYHPRVVKKAKTLRFIMENGKTFSCTDDHRVLLRTAEWIEAKDLKIGDELMPFYRLSGSPTRKGKSGAYSKVLSLQEGWKTEKNFIDSWRKGTPINDLKVRFNRLSRSKLTRSQIASLLKMDQFKLRSIDKDFTLHEIKKLNERFSDKVRIIHISEGSEEDVYDLSVKKYENFATDTTVFHNCQIGSNGHLIDIQVENKDIAKELNELFHRRLRIDRNLYNIAKSLYVKGDHFLELIIDPEDPKLGIIKFQTLPCDSMYRIETIKAKLIEFQQSKEGPDYQALMKYDVMTSSPEELSQSTAIRFTPNQIVHMRIGEDRSTFYPYGISLIEAARGPAHNLKLMQDAMMIYRLCLTADTRIRTTKGYKFINELTSADIVFSYKDGKQIPAPVLWMKSSGFDEVYSVRSKHVEIKGNGKHPILVLRDGKEQYVKISELIPKKDKFILTQDDSSVPCPIPTLIGEPWAKLTDSQRALFRKKKYENRSKLMRETGDLGRTRQFLYTPQKALPLAKAELICDIFGLDKSQLIIVDKNEYNENRLNLPSFVDEEFARLLGFLMGDGYFAKHNFGFSTGIYQEVNEKYRKLLEKYFGVVKFELDKRSAIGCGKYIVNHTKARNILSLLGVAELHNISRIPQWVFTSPKAIRRSFVEGFSDADGCERYTNKGTWFSTIELSNLGLIKDIKELWSSIGLCSGHIKTRKKLSHFINDREIPETISHSVTISELLLPRAENVHKITFVGNEEVFDLSVDNEEHNFIANSIPVHNSRAPERRVFFIDVGGLPPFRAESMMQKMQDMFRKKKVYNARGGTGASAVEERNNVPSVDEDFWIPTKAGSNTRIETLPGACLSLDTKIPLLDGRVLTLNDIITEYNSGKKLWTYSCCPITGKPSPGLISWAGVTRKNTEVVKVLFDNGKSIVCTPDHKFPVQQIGKIQAKDLQPGMSMFQFATKKEQLSAKWKGKYEQIYDSSLKKWEFVHRMVMKSIKNTDYENATFFDEKYEFDKKTVIHHIDHDKFNNDPSNLTWMNWNDHIELHRFYQESMNKNISNSLKKYHEELNDIEKEIRNKILKERGLKGNLVTLAKLKDEEFNKEFRKKQIAGFEKSKIKNPENYAKWCKKTSDRNYQFWSNESNKQKVFAKQTIVYPKAIFDKFLDLVKEGKNLSDSVKIINSDSDLVEMFKNANQHIVRKETILSTGITKHQITKMVKEYGYKNIRHLKREANQYNHKVVSVEFLSERIDTGTLTIDQNHEVNDYHTFAISDCGIFTCNSNLGEVDDVVFFRNQLFAALNFPKNYLTQEDASITKMSLSSVDYRFSRSVERLQSSISDGLMEIALRHLELVGYPEELYEDLKINLTSPSHGRELSENEVIQVRYDRALSLKGSGLMSDYDIFTKILKVTQEEAKELVARATIQKIQDLKMQTMAANPELMGIAKPSPEGNEMGVNAGGPNPELTGQENPEQGQPGEIPGTFQPPESAEDSLGTPEKLEGKPLPDPSEQDIKKYDLEIISLMQDSDAEEIDISEIN